MTQESSGGHRRLQPMRADWRRQYQGWLVGLLAVLLVAGCDGGIELTEREHLARATVFERQGDYSSAIIDYKNAIRLNPANAEARWLLGRLYLNLKFATAAEKELRNARNAGLSTQALDFALAEALLQQARFEEALDELGGTAELDVTTLEPRQLVLRGKALVHLLRNDEAEDAYREALGRQPGMPEATLGLARLALEANAYVSAESLINEVLAEFPNRLDGLMLKGDLHRMRGERQDALDLYGRVVELDPGNIPAHLSRATIFAEMGLFDQASLDVDVVRKYVPDYPLASYIKAVTEYGRENYEEAERYLHDVIDRVPFHIKSIFLLASIQFRDEAYTQAELNLQTVIDADPKHFRARVLMGAVLLKQDKASDALAILEPLSGDHPDDAPLNNLLAAAYIQVKDFAKAAALIERAVAGNPSDVALKNRLGLVHVAAGDVDKAEAVFRSSIGLGADQGSIDSIMALSGVSSGNFKLAVAAADRLVVANPDAPIGYYTRGKVLAGEGDELGARVAFEKSLDIEAGFLPAVLQLSNLDFKQGKIDAALARLKNALAADSKNPVLLMELGRISKFKGELHQAADYLDRARLQASGELMPHLMLATLLVQMAEPERALAVLGDVAERYRVEPRVVEMTGLAYMASSRPEEAISAFSQLVALLPKQAVAYFRLAQAYGRGGRYALALENLDAALQLEPRFLHALELTVQLHRENNEPDKALEVARQMQALYPLRAQASLLEGDILMQRGDFAGAVQAYTQALAKQPDRTIVVKLYKARRLNKQAAEAYELMTLWLGDNPSDYQARMLLADGYLADGMATEALAQYFTVLDDHPEQLEALNNAAWLLLDARDTRALELAQRAYELAPENPVVVDTLGWTLAEQGDAGRAEELLQAAVVALPHRPDIRYHWAVALYRSGREDEARAELESLQRSAPGFEYTEQVRSLLARIKD